IGSTATGRRTRPAVQPQRPARGLTLLELMLITLIVGILAELGAVTYANYRERVDIATAQRDIGALSVDVAQFAVDHNGLPDALAAMGRGGMVDPWGNPYQYINHANLRGNGHVRKDKNIVPINSDFDLYSMGKDG